MTMDGPNTFDDYGIMNPDANGPGQIHSKLSEEDSRKLILESYEKAGVDLPLVTLETILDREISEDDARQSGAPRFRKFLNKASSAMTNRTFNKDDVSEEGPDDEIGADALSVPSAASYTSNFNAEYETPETNPAQLDDPADTPQTPDRSANIASMTADGAAEIPPPTPEAMKNDCHATFDFCCPKSADASPAKYVVSNLQLPEGFEDEQQSVDVQEPMDVPALMDTEESMMDESSYKIENDGQVSKGNGGLMSFFHGSRRFRFAVLVCCLLHVVLIGLIIAFVTNRENESFQAGSSSASIAQGQTATTPPEDFVTANTLLPDPDLDQQLDVAVEDTTDATDIATNTTTEDVQEVVQEVVQEGEAPVAAEDVSMEACVDKLELDATCFGVDSELFVSFVSCTPQVGDWVAIFETAADPQNLLLADAIGWLYTCGDRFCEEAVEEQNLSFTRAKERAQVGGTYKAHLIREGLGPAFSAIASSSEFQIVPDASC